MYFASTGIIKPPSNRCRNTEEKVSIIKKYLSSVRPIAVNLAEFENK